MRKGCDKMFILYYKNTDNKRLEIAKCKTFKQCVDKMYDYLNGFNFKTYYQRFILRNNDNVITVDYGSYYNFLEITSDTNDNVIDEYRKYNEILNLNENIHNNKQKKELMNRLINLYEQVESMDNSETKLVIQEFINQKERKLGELLSESRTN